MALTLVKVAATPCALKYTWIGTSGVGSKLAAALIADCAAGPLKTLLTQVNAGLNAGVSGLTWATLMYSSLLSVYTVTEGSSGAFTNDIGALFASGANRFDVLGEFGGSTQNGVVEIRFHPTAVR